MKNKKELSLEYLKNQLYCYPDTGTLIWQFKDGNSKGKKMFNTRYGGKEAGTKTYYGYVVINIDGKKFFVHI